MLEDALWGGKGQGAWPEEIYREYLLCPRIYYEELTAYHSFIDGYFYGSGERSIQGRTGEALSLYRKRNQL